MIYSKYIKRLIDIILSLLVLVPFCWLYLILAILVRVKLGSPVIFKQPRPGKDGKVFNLYKFRTMTDAKDENGNLLPDEDRLPEFGKKLRATSLDELPQIFNVLAGQMAFVGPRAPVYGHFPSYSTLPDYVKKRFSVLPGITGYAQCTGRNELTWEDKIKMDNIYVDRVKKFGIFFDIRFLSDCQ